ncbi:MAG TPA: hypothetical protein PKD86_16660 [Gemmatales bacterium]|nr:hypothetical protein [Gemmatales bacterium]HMP60977.1 hypothetical protein [Gemmatales bacterium]
MPFWLTCILTAAMGVGLLGQDAPTPPPEAPRGTVQPDADDPLSEQAIIAARYRQLEEMLLRIAQKLERSGHAESVKKARVIQKSLKEARDKGIAINLNQLADSLRSPNLATLKQAVDRGQDIKADLEALLLSLLMEDENNSEQIKLITQLLKELDQALRDQKLANAQNQSPSVPKEVAAKAQQIAEERVKQILEKIKAEERRQGKSDERSGAKDPKDSRDSKDSQDSKDSKDTKDPKDAQGDPKESKDPKDTKDSKDSQEPKEQEQKKPSEGEQSHSESQQQQGESGGLPKQQMQDAQDAQQQARKRIDENRRQEASPEQQEATRKLEEARKRLEEILRQLREEEQIRVLADLQRRCEKMLQMQEIIYEGTKRVSAKLQSYPESQPTRDEEIVSRRLSEDEDKIGLELDQAILVLDAEGTSVAFAEIFRQLRKDVGHVVRRLARVSVGPDTQMIQEDIIATLKEMIEALKQQQKEIRDRKDQQQQDPNSAQQDQSLLDMLAELRMIRALQVRVQQRTEKWAKLYKGEQAADAQIIHELRDLAERQLTIYQITDNLAKGRNR